MKILLIKPLAHPEVLEISDTLDSMYAVLDCRTITAVYPWPEAVALVCDDEGLLTDKLPNRYLPELGQPIMGSFFLCGLGADSFADLPDDLIERYTKRFWAPEDFRFL